ncbi:MAG: hypothetical protein [Microvirus sp.]|nr:MAG: hypothetical protein [Microvirus sp.]
MYRHPVNKAKSAAKFRGQSRRTKRPNVAGPVMRGGIRF